MTAVLEEFVACCPKCGGQMWDNRLTKKNAKAPDFKCRNQSCDGVIWPPRNQKAAPRKPAPAVQYPSSRPESELPRELRHEVKDAEEARDLSQRIGADMTKLQADLTLYTSITEWLIRDIAPIYEKSKIGWSPEAATAAAATIFIQAKRGQ